MNDPDEQQAWLMVEKIADLIADRDAWIKAAADNGAAKDAAEGERDRIRGAAEWLIVNRGHRGEQQAWKLLADALAKEDTDE